MTSSAETKIIRIMLTVAVAFHLGISAWHGLAHSHAKVRLDTLQTTFVNVMVVAFPLLGIVLLWTRKQFVGACVVSLSMLVSLIFGFICHFFLISDDYVLAIPSGVWQHTFVVTAGLIIVVDTVGTVLSLCAILTWPVSQPTVVPSKPMLPPESPRTPLATDDSNGHRFSA